MSPCAPQFTLIESAVAACLIDGMTYVAAGQAIGVDETRVGRVARRLYERFDFTDRASLVFELREIAEDCRPFEFRETLPVDVRGPGKDAE